MCLIWGTTYLAIARFLLPARTPFASRLPAPYAASIATASAAEALDVGRRDARESGTLTFTRAALPPSVMLSDRSRISRYIYALKYLPVSVVSLYAYANPVIAVLLGAVLLDEPFGPRVIVATGNGTSGNYGGA